MLRLLLCIVLFSNLALAVNDPLGLENQSELGYVLVGGNAESETISIKQQSVYNWQHDSLKFTAHYIQASGIVDAPTATEPNRQENKITAENWAAKLRYERVITPKWFKMFTGYGWAGNRFIGVREEQMIDLGGKYYTANSKTYQQFFELGYQYNRQLLTKPPVPGKELGVGKNISPEFHLLRIYAEAIYNHSKSFSLGAWVEYKPSVTNPEDQFINYSPYLTSILTDMFSLKVAYEGHYRSTPAEAGNRLTDYTFTTSLLAKF